MLAAVEYQQDPDVSETFSPNCKQPPKVVEDPHAPHAPPICKQTGGGVGEYGGRKGMTGGVDGSAGAHEWAGQLCGRGDAFSRQRFDRLSQNRVRTPCSSSKPVFYLSLSAPLRHRASRALLAAPPWRALQASRTERFYA
eukprot:638193-Rhodomonas_salina.7